ncbi:unnamed protein product [Aphanomyces euteiches]
MLSRRIVNSVARENSRVDVVALQQRVLAESPIFRLVTGTNEDELFEYLHNNDKQLNARDTVGATPLLISFLYAKFDLGKRIISTYPVTKGFQYALAMYDTLDPKKPSPYHGENILHIAIVHRNLDVVRWLVDTLPDLLDAEATGMFFSPGHACYFGGSPLLFALSSRQLEAATYILRAADAAPPTSNAAKTSIFMMDAYGNNALHLAVIHDLPDVYDFAVRHAMARFPDACPPHFDPNDPKASYDLPLFMKNLHGTEKDHFERFIRKPNTDYLSPLTLAAAMGKATMFQHILMSLAIKSWTYGPVTSMMIPLKGLEERTWRPKTKKKAVSERAVRPMTSEAPKVETSAHSPLNEASQLQHLLERRNVKTAIECLGSNSKLSNCINDKQLDTVVRDRLEIIDSFEVKMVLDKKWEFAGQRLFLWNFGHHVVFCIVFTTSTFYTHHYRDDGANIEWSQSWLHVVLECLILLEMIYRIYYEVKQVRKNGVMGYLEDSGAAMVDNILKLAFCILIVLAVIFRLMGYPNNEDACVSLALLSTYLYFFFFLLGFRSTGPFIVMIMRMLIIDVGRFLMIYVFVLTGFGMSLYIVVDQRGGISAWWQRIKSLMLASFCATFTWTDYTGNELSQLSQVLVFTYLFIVAIVFVNLLIATMGNTYEAIFEASEQQWYAERANIMSSMETALTKAQREKNRTRYAVDLDGERYLQIEYVDSDKWLGVHEHDMAKAFEEFKQAVVLYRDRKMARDDDESPMQINLIDARLHELHNALF